MSRKVARSVAGRRRIGVEEATVVAANRRGAVGAARAGAQLSIAQRVGGAFVAVAEAGLIAKRRLVRR